MKKTLITLLVAASASVLTAGTVRDNCGCGIGTMALGDETGLLSHLAATFLNNISGNQTFGISSGTLECEQATAMVSVKEVETFIANNMDHIVIEASMGEGAYLSALADLLQIEEANRGNFFLSMQVNFDRIFPADNLTASHVTGSIVKLI
ncbi:MAG: DUF3015 family protein [Verrucomicrobia bacterium]|nr:DUF3015 family protein [Verrucomicrobiota bacterium]MCH8528764.1 DUF3015 domain-containing protein [Kiritimatiellia bacterium]